MHDDDNPSCPLCEQNLSASRKKFLKSTFAKQEQSITHKLKRFTSIIKKLKELLVEQHAALAERKKNLEASTRHAAQHAELEKSIAKFESLFESITKQLSQAHTTLSVLQESIVRENANLATLTTDNEKSLQQNNEYQQAKADLQTLENNYKNNPYNAAQHQADMQQLQTIELQLHDYAALREQIASQKQRELYLRSLCSQLKKIKEIKNQLVQEMGSYKSLNELERNIVLKEEKLLAVDLSLREEKDRLLQEKGRLENQQEKINKLDQEYKKHSECIVALRDTIDDYQAIALATGKDGIQALLIEDAIPEIEQEANNLLSKLTNNQAHILIESVRDLKKGGTKETLDIKISDAVGIRPYEMFSGGEAFRIDFALRVAISKLLARRAGTSLQTLIIDEGFGSQDEEGLTHIMDALYKIQDDFSKIIIVSHLPSMKDQFPVHFVIEKGPNGSSVKVIEQG